MKYKYQARNKQGELQMGYVEAPSKDMAVQILSNHELFVLSIASEEKKGINNTIFGVLNRVKTKDVMIFTRQLATLIESELPLSNSLKILWEQTVNPILKEATFQIFQDVQAGLAFSQAIERQKPIFSDFYVSMIRSAEVTGRLEHALQFLASYLEKEVQWKGKVSNAMIYPAVLFFLFMIVGSIMVITVFPKIEPLFTESGAELPMLTKIVFGAGSFLVSWWWMVLVILVGLVSVIWDYLKSDEGKDVAGQILLVLPVFGKLFRKLYITRFAQSFSVLIQGGIPVTQAIEIAGDTIDNSVYRAVFQVIANGVREGGLFSNLLLGYSKYFPPMVGQMTAVGETTGRLDEIMLKIADFYEKEVNNILANLSELLQPFILVIVGLLVGLLFAAVLTPIYNLAQSFTM